MYLLESVSFVTLVVCATTIIYDIYVRCAAQAVQHTPHMYEWSDTIRSSMIFEVDHAAIACAVRYIPR